MEWYFHIRFLFCVILLNLKIVPSVSLSDQFPTAAHPITLYHLTYRNHFNFKCFHLSQWPLLWDQAGFTTKSWLHLNVISENSLVQQELIMWAKLSHVKNQADRKLLCAQPTISFVNLYNRRKVGNFYVGLLPHCSLILFQNSLWKKAKEN